MQTWRQGVGAGNRAMVLRGQAYQGDSDTALDCLTHGPHAGDSTPLVPSNHLAVFLVTVSAHWMWRSESQQLPGRRGVVTQERSRGARRTVTTSTGRADTCPGHPSRARKLTGEHQQGETHGKRCCELCSFEAGPLKRCQVPVTQDTAIGERWRKQREPEGAWLKEGPVHTRRGVESVLLAPLGPTAAPPPPPALHPAGVRWGLSGGREEPLPREGAQKGSQSQDPFWKQRGGQGQELSPCSQGAGRHPGSAEGLWGPAILWYSSLWPAVWGGRGDGYYEFRVCDFQYQNGAWGHDPGGERSAFFCSEGGQETQWPATAKWPQAGSHPR